jgi:hypothetical protein
MGWNAIIELFLLNRKFSAGLASGGLGMETGLVEHDRVEEG